MGGLNIAELSDMPIVKISKFMEELKFSPSNEIIARPILREIQARLKFLIDVGLGYLTLSRGAATLSGGEAQRVKLATELSKRSTGKTVYILDEPTTGLHIADVDKLIKILQRLASGGNTVIVIEHNLDVIKTADYIIDLGPEGGDGGGQVVALGTPEEVAACPDSYTGAFLKPLLKKADKPD